MAGKGSAPSMSKGGEKSGSLAKGTTKGHKSGFVVSPAAMVKGKGSKC